jgi:hypothetical protein
MNNTDAKFILHGYRPSGADAAERTMAEALAQAKADPALGVWLAREQAHGAAVAAKLREIAPPAGLREAILAGGRMSRGVGEAPRRGWWTQPVWLAAAAAVLFIFTASVAMWPKRAAADSALASYAFGDALEVTKHGGHGEETGSFQATLGNDATHLASSLPINFSALRGNGCRTVSVAGHDVLEVCFQRGGAWFHCYVARVEDFPDAPAKTEPNFAERGQVSVAAWADGAHRIVVASVAGRAAIERLL